MADNVTLKLEGVDSLKDALQRLPIKVEKRAATTATREPAKILRRLLRQNAPVLTGGLRRAIVYRKRKTRRGSGVVGYKVRVLRSHAYIARFLEYGTAKMPPHPWFWRTYDGKERALVTELLAKMSEAVDIEAGREFARQSRRR